MGSGRALVGKVLITLLVSQIFTTAHLKPLRTHNDAETNGLVRRGVLKFMAGGLAGMFAVHEIKRHNPCAFHGWGLTDKGQMDHKLAANKRCNHYYEKYKGDLTKCPDPQSADCTEVDGDTKCAVHMADGSVMAIYDCA